MAETVGLPCIIPSPFMYYDDLTFQEKISEKCLRDLMCHKSLTVGKTDQNSLSSLYTTLQPDWLYGDESVQTQSYYSSSWSRRPTSSWASRLVKKTSFKH